MLSKPSGSEPIPLGTLAYFCARNKHRAYSLVIGELQNSGLSQADLARRLRKSPAQLSRYLSGPGNWTLDTLSGLLFAISGAEPEYDVSYPLDLAPRNLTAPVWSLDDLPKRPTSANVNSTAHFTLDSKVLAAQ